MGTRLSGAAQNNVDIRGLLGMAHICDVGMEFRSLIALFFTFAYGDPMSRFPSRGLSNSHDLFQPTKSGSVKMSQNGRGIRRERNGKFKRLRGITSHICHRG